MNKRPRKRRFRGVEMGRTKDLGHELEPVILQGCRCWIFSGLVSSNSFIWTIGSGAWILRAAHWTYLAQMASRRLPFRPAPSEEPARAFFSLTDFHGMICFTAFGFLSSGGPKSARQSSDLFDFRVGAYLSAPKRVCRHWVSVIVLSASVVCYSSYAALSVGYIT